MTNLNIWKLTKRSKKWMTLDNKWRVAMKVLYGILWDRNARIIRDMVCLLSERSVVRSENLEIQLKFKLN